MKIIIDGIECRTEYGEFLLEAAKRNNIRIPSLCHDEALPGQACCRICIVEAIVKGRSRIVTSCVYPITEELEVITGSEKIMGMRRMIIALLYARAPESIAVRELAEQYGVSPIPRFKTDDKEKCMLCSLCVSACNKLGTGAIATVNRGITKKVATPYDEPSVSCIGCGACANVCPNGVIEIHEKAGKREIWNKEFELISCTGCGESYATREQLEHADARLEVKLRQYGSGFLCEKCRRLAAVSQHKDIRKYSMVNET